MAFSTHEIDGGLRHNPRTERMQRQARDGQAPSGEAAFDRFCDPRASRYRGADHETLVARARFHLAKADAVRLSTTQGDIQAYVYEPEGIWNGKSVLVVHGWTSEASFMTAYAEHFRKRGFRVVLFDLPAHGQSARDRASLIDCAHAVREVAEALGPIAYVVAHSLGGMAALQAGGGAPMPRPYPFQAYVLVAMPNEFSTITRTFGMDERLSPEIQRAFEARLEAISLRRVADFTGINLIAEAGKPTLLVHSRDDEDVSFAQAEAIAASGVGAELLPFNDYGHRKILYAPPAVRAAGAFLLRQMQA